MRHPTPRLDPHLAPGETVLHEFRPDPAGAKSWGATLATALWSVPLGLLLLYLAAVQPPSFDVPWFLAAPAGLVVLAIAPAERAIARRRLHGMLAALTERQLLLLPSEGEPRGIAPFDIRTIEVTPGPGGLGTLHLRPAFATLPALPRPDAVARDIAAWAEERAGLWRDWTLSRLAEAPPDEHALTVLRRPDLGLTIALPRDWRVEVRGDGGRWTALRHAAPGWTALRAEGAASSRFELAVSHGPVAATQGGTAEPIAIGPWRGTATTHRTGGEATPGVRIVARDPVPLPHRIVAALFGAKAARSFLPVDALRPRAELHREILLDAAPRQIRLSLTGHADAPEAWAVLEATAAALRPA